MELENLPKPITNSEHYWRYIAENLGGGGGGSSVLVTKTVTENGVYSAADDSADGYSRVTVNVPAEIPDEIRDTIEDITHERPETVEEVITAIEKIEDDVPDEIKDAIEDITGNRPETKDEVIGAIEDIEYINVPEVDPDDPTHITGDGAISVQGSDDLDTCLGNMGTYFTGEESIVIPKILTVRAWLKKYTATTNYSKEAAAEVILDGIGRAVQNPLTTRVMLKDSHYIRISRIYLSIAEQTTTGQYTLQCSFTFAGQFEVDMHGTRTSWRTSTFEIRVYESDLPRADMEDIISNSRYIILQG